MGHMTPHEILINTLSSTVLNLVPLISVPVAPSGTLREEFGYEIRLPEFGETIEELMKKKGAKVPDLLLVNEEEKLLVVVECKSEFNLETEKKLSKQIEFYSKENFKFENLENLEIWIFTNKGLGKNTGVFVENMTQEASDLANIVIWEAEFKKGGEEAEIKKVYGKHQDPKLDERMQSQGLTCCPPLIDLLIDPTLTYPERVYRIGRRIFTFMCSRFLTKEQRTISVDDFKTKHLDAIITNKELKRCFKYLTMMIPEIGEISSEGQMILRKRPPLDKIKVKLEMIQKMNVEEFKVELWKISKKRLPKVPEVKKPKAVKYPLDKWIKKENTLKNSFYYSVSYSRLNRLEPFEDNMFSYTKKKELAEYSEPSFVIDSFESL